MTDLEQAKATLRAELKRLGFTSHGIKAISIHVARYTATAIRLDRAKRRRPVRVRNEFAEVCDVVLNGRPAPRG